MSTKTVDMSMDYEEDILVDTRNRFRTKSLFRESSQVKGHIEPLWTLQEHSFTDKKGKRWQSLRELFLAENDMTEYSFAMKYFRSWRHWKHLTSLAWFEPYVSDWREELELQGRIKGIKRQFELAEEGNPAATKWIAEGSWNKGRGRPSKAEKERHLKVETRIEDSIQDDLDRLQLVVNND